MPYLTVLRLTPWPLEVARVWPEKHSNALPDCPPPDAMATRGSLVEAALGPGSGGPGKGLTGIVTGLIFHSGPRTGPSAKGLVFHYLQKCFNYKIKTDIIFVTFEKTFRRQELTLAVLFLSPGPQMVSQTPHSDQEERTQSWGQGTEQDSSRYWLPPHRLKQRQY